MNPLRIDRQVCGGGGGGGGGSGVLLYISYIGMICVAPKGMSFQEPFLYEIGILTVSKQHIANYVH